MRNEFKDTVEKLLGDYSKNPEHFRDEEKEQYFFDKATEYYFHGGGFQGFWYYIRKYWKAKENYLESRR